MSDDISFSYWIKPTPASATRPVTHLICCEAKRRGEILVTHYTISAKIAESPGGPSTVHRICIHLRLRLISAFEELDAARKQRMARRLAEAAA